MTRKTLPLPLHCYDEGGVVKPPAWLYMMLIAVCADWLVFIFAVALREQTTFLLQLFYPQRSYLVLRLSITLPFVTVFLLLGNRERLWKNSWTSWRRWIFPLLFIGVLASICAQLWQIAVYHWQYHGLNAMMLLLAVVFLVCVARSRHLRLMVQDWRNPRPGNSNPTHVKPES